ncbi:MAG: hypothetical protein QGH60_20120 [Phycisphaerae bacterium]|jgi:hypothetical protein|nr:hypothetical protein [Phycisphaerae bacterium]
MSYSGILKNGIFLWALFGVVLSVLSGSAGAAPVTFDVTFYGADTDHIVATGVVVIDDSKLTLGTGVSINQSAYIAGLVEAEITVVGNVYDTSLAPELYIRDFPDVIAPATIAGLSQ